MYKKILIPLENSVTDSAILDHIRSLTKITGAKLLLVHVADGWAARNFNQLKLAESTEMKEDRAYLEGVAVRLRTAGLEVTVELVLGNPPTEILKAADARACDLIAMTSHGHKLLGDFFLGSTIDKVRHNTVIPILVVRAGAGSATPFAS